MKNCWEIKKCGRGPNGKNAAKEGICPAAVETRTHNVNNGVNGGRACWAVAGSFHNENKDGTIERKAFTCLKCHCYKRVWEEEHKSGSYVEIHEICRMLDDN
ncbi:MAG: hypothetical protein Q8880_09970 [Bacteroidota bacterium]|nr:hypothetical protein [Bacteroidota bacterium]